MFKWLKGLLRGHAAEAVREAIVTLTVDSLKEGGRITIKEAVRKITDHHRAELWAFILGLPDEKARKALIRRHRKATRGSPGEENRFVDLLTRLWLVLKDDPKNCEIIFTKLGRLSEGEFNQTLYFLENDVISQWYKKTEAVILETAKDLAATGITAAKTAVFIANKKARKANRILTPIRDRLRDDIRERRGKWIR